MELPIPQMMQYANPFGWSQEGGQGWLSKLFKGGLNSFGAQGLLSFGLPALATMFGGGRARANAYDQWNAQRAAVMNPLWLYNRIGSYQGLANQYSQGSRASILNNSNAFQNNLNRNLAATGLNRGGIGALASTAASSVAANQLTDLDSENRRQSMTLGLNDRNNLLRMLDMGPVYNDSPWLEAFGSGADNFMGYMMDRKMGRG